MSTKRPVRSAAFWMFLLALLLLTELLSYPWVVAWRVQCKGRPEWLEGPLSYVFLPLKALNFFLPGVVRDWYEQYVVWCIRDVAGIQLFL